MGNVTDKRKSVTYAPSVNLSPDLITGPTVNGHSFGAKSMPASRRTSASSHDEELAVHIQGLSLAGERSTRASPVPAPVSASILLRSNGRYGEDEGARYASTYNAGMMLDEQLDKEMHSESCPHPGSFDPLFNNLLVDAMRNLPTSDDDKYGNTYPSKVSSRLFPDYHLSHQLLDISRVGGPGPGTYVADVSTCTLH